MKERFINSFKKHMKWYITGASLVAVVTAVFICFKAFVKAADDFTITISQGVQTTTLLAVSCTSDGWPTNLPTGFRSGPQLDNYEWRSSDPFCVIDLNSPIDNFLTGANFRPIAAGSSTIYREYSELHYYLDSDFTVEATPAQIAANSNLPSKEVSARSNGLNVTVPLRTNIEFYSNGTISNNILKTNNSDTVKIFYNGYTHEYVVGPNTYYDEDTPHRTEFIYNQNILRGDDSTRTLNPNGTDNIADFDVIGAGYTKIVGSVDGVLSPVGEVYVGVKFTDDIRLTGISIEQYKNFALSERETNVKNATFGYQDTEGNRSVYFWTEEDRGTVGQISPFPVVRVSETGVITALNAGVTYVYASCKPMEESYDSNGILDASIADRVEVTVPMQFLFGSQTIVTVGDNIPIKTTAYLPNTTYGLINPDDVIDQNGDKDMYIALKAGKAEVEVTAKYYIHGVENSETKRIEVIVIDKLTLSRESASVNIGSSVDVSATPTCTDDLRGTPLKWESANPEIATVEFPEGADPTTIDGSLNVIIRGIAKGRTAITCTQVVEQVVKIATVVVDVMVPVNGLTLSEPQDGNQYLNMYLGSTKTIMAMLQYDFEEVPDNTKLNWYFSTENVISLQNDETTGGVNQTNVVTAVGIGMTTLTVFSEDNNRMVSVDIIVTEAPTSIKISDTELTLKMSLLQYQLKAYVQSPNNGAEQKIVWMSDNTSVCTVDSETGLVTLVSPGQATIRVESVIDPHVYANCRITIVKDVTEVGVDKKSLTLNVGDTYRLTASVKPDDATDRTITWTSSNTSVIRVENTNRYENNLTAVGSGNAIVIAQTNDGGYIAYCDIHVLQPVTSIEISSAEMSVRKGTEFYLNATALPTNADDKTIVWSTNDNEVATVGSDGKVITLKVGQCVITATNPASGVSASCVVNVLEPITGLTLNTYSQNMVKGMKFVLIPTVEPDTASNKSVTFRSSDNDVATVDEMGVVTAVSGGVCQIVVTTVESAFTATCTIMVKEYVTSVELSDEFRYLNFGDTYTLSVKVETATATDKTVIWSTSNDKVVTVNQVGVISGVGYGTAIITATAADGSGASDSCVVQVIKPVSSITLDKSKVSMYVGDVIHITATIDPPDATVKKLLWTSSDPSIAKVYDDGDVEAISVGRCKIYAMSTDGNEIIAECTIIVKQIVSASSITINSHEILMLTGKMRTLTARLYPVNATETIHWLSTDTSIVVVDENGQITTVGPGVCEVVAYTTYGTMEDRCTVYSMAISKPSLVIEQYDTFNLYVDGAPRAASWRSSNPRIATVTQGGVVTARMPGECTISATVDGKTVTCSVSVRSIDPDKFINKTTNQ